MSDELERVKARAISGEVLPAERDEDPSTVVLTNGEAFAVYEWLSGSDGPRYWEEPRLASLYARLREWFRYEAPW